MGSHLLRGVVILAVVAGTLSLAGGSSASHPGPTLSGRLVFEESSTPCPSGHCRTHITVMNAHGSGRKMLTTNTYSNDTSPKWSPNGRLIIFSHTAKRARDTGLEVMRANGTGVRLLATPGKNTADFSTLTWSADGKRAFYIGTSFKQRCPTCRSVETFSVMAVHVAGMPRPKRLFKLPGDGMNGTSWSDPAESPDGKWIALKKGFCTKSDCPLFEIWLVHPDGTSLHRLVRVNDDASALAFSPDSKRLAYASFFPQTSCPNEDNETDNFQTIWVVPVAGGKPTPMWNMQCNSSPAPTDFLPDGVKTISWSPDGRQIVYPTTDWEPATQSTPPNEVKLALVLHVVNVVTGDITGIPNSRQSSDNCHGPSGSASGPCLLIDPDWTG